MSLGACALEAASAFKASRLELRAIKSPTRNSFPLELGVFVPPCASGLGLGDPVWRSCDCAVRIRINPHPNSYPLHLCRGVWNPTRKERSWATNWHKWGTISAWDKEELSKGDELGNKLVWRAGQWIRNFPSSGCLKNMFECLEIWDLCWGICWAVPFLLLYILIWFCSSSSRITFHTHF